MAAGLEHALDTLLRADAGLIALLGTGNNMRLYPVEMPQTATIPAVVWSVVGETFRFRAGGGYAGISRTRVRLAIHADATDPDKYVSVDQALLALLGDYRGTVVTSSGSVVILDCDRVGQQDLPRSEQSRYFRRETDYMFQWREP